MIHSLPKVLESVQWIASAGSHHAAAMSSFGATMTVVVIVFSPSHVWQHCGYFHVDSCPKGLHCSHCCIIQVIYAPKYVNIGSHHIYHLLQVTGFDVFKTHFLWWWCVNSLKPFERLHLPAKREKTGAERFHSSVTWTDETFRREVHERAHRLTSGSSHRS